MRHTGGTGHKLRNLYAWRYFMCAEDSEAYRYMVMRFNYVGCANSFIVCAPLVRLNGG